MNILTWSFLLLCLVLILFKALGYLRPSSDGNELPPGPRPLPIIGNVFDLPTKQVWSEFAKWTDTYGPIISVSALGQRIVIINSLSIARDLLEKRSNIFSDRPYIPMLDLMGFDVFNLTMRRFGLEWRAGRRIADHSLRPAATLTYRPFLVSKNHQLMQQLLRTPDNFVEHLRHFAAAIAMNIAYGYEIAPANDRYVAIAEDAIDRAVNACLPGRRLVNIFPSLRHLPEWLPGMGFKDYAREAAKCTAEMVDRPYAFVKEQMQHGLALPSICKENLESYDLVSPTTEQENMIKYVAATVYAAGADTTVGVLHTFFLAMTLYPSIQTRAQAEIDSVLEGKALPTFEDEPNLPYVKALCMELIRWKPITPVAIPHVNIEADVYGKYYIPKGSQIIANAWAMLHDPVAYPNPDDFSPERFIGPHGEFVEDPDLTVAFGWGRRLCPGRHLALSSVWIVVATVLATFHIAKAKDEYGKEIDVSGEYTDGLVSHPMPFKCTITPRSEDAAFLVKSTLTMQT
ncbi:cytochrome P450 [Stereum hirsutum FP-91666 SS1]|uniref:cytochrome P450 n=1 Tax=Stereum hirsutum (strain FP-91666) TaxID=721885 RepID=UPI0004449910|nr:cytochrome P450 [Stereum hirsutum FP-91666 SS1]EIM85912.1 cytochrome P450 [Stereum hirsutum FP-91666 SS1]